MYILTNDLKHIWCFTVPFVKKCYTRYKEKSQIRYARKRSSAVISIVSKIDLATNPISRARYGVRRISRFAGISRELVHHARLEDVNILSGVRDPDSTA